MSDGLLSADEIQNDFVDVLCAYPHRAAARLVVEKWRQHIAALEARHARELEFARHEKCPVCGDQGCTNCSVELLRKDHASTLAAIRAELEKLPHEGRCASKRYEQVPFGAKAREEYYARHVCNCARGRALKLAGGQE